MLDVARGSVVTELIGVVGFNWMLLDAEHAPNDAPLIPQHMALKDSVSAPVVRLQANDAVACTEHAQQLGCASPLCSLMVVKD